jgi:hypothetical protein
MAGQSCSWWIVDVVVDMPGQSHFSMGEFPIADRSLARAFSPGFGGFDGSGLLGGDKAGAGNQPEEVCELLIFSGAASRKDYDWRRTMRLETRT